MCILVSLIVSNNTVSINCSNLSCSSTILASIQLSTVSCYSECVFISSDSYILSSWEDKLRSQLILRKWWEVRFCNVRNNNLTTFKYIKQIKFEVCYCYSNRFFHISFYIRLIRWPSFSNLLVILNYSTRHCDACFHRNCDISTSSVYWFISHSSEHLCLRLFNKSQSFCRSYCPLYYCSSNSFRIRYFCYCSCTSFTQSDSTSIIFLQCICCMEVRLVQLRFSINIIHVEVSQFGNIVLTTIVISIFSEYFTESVNCTLNNLCLNPSYSNHLIRNLSGIYQFYT